MINNNRKIIINIINNYKIVNIINKINIHWILLRNHLLNYKFVIGDQKISSNSNKIRKNKYKNLNKFNSNNNSKNSKICILIINKKKF